MTAHATPEQVAALEEAADAIRTRAAHLAELARELGEIADGEVDDEFVVPTTRRLLELDQLLTGELVLPDALAAIPGLDQVLEHHETLLDES